MNQNTFFAVFIIICAAITLFIKEYWDSDIFSNYIIVFMVFGYLAGRYSINFPKK